MAVKVVVRVTSERPCMMNVLGEFEADETKEFSDPGTFQLFKDIYGYGIGRMNLPVWMSAEVVLVDVDETEEA